MAMGEHDGIAPATIFSPDRKYRYLLTRRISMFSDRSILFCILNPSKADEERDDSTVSKVCRHARGWGYGWVLVVNVSPLRSTDPKMMLAAGDEPEEVREINLHVIRETAAIVDIVVVAWGVDGAAEGRAERTLEALAEVHSKLYCIGTTQGGEPLHPLYLRKDEQLRPYRRLIQP